MPRRRVEADDADAETPTRQNGEPKPVVPYCPVRCWGCGASGRSRIKTTGRAGRRRYHLCRECGLSFLSEEVPPAERRK